MLLTAMLAITMADVGAGDHMSKCSSDLVMHHFLESDAEQWQVYCEHCGSRSANSARIGQIDLNGTAPPEAWIIELWGVLWPIPRADYESFILDESLVEHGMQAAFLKSRNGSLVSLEIEQARGLFNISRDAIASSKALRVEERGFKQLFPANTSRVDLAVRGSSVHTDEISCQEGDRAKDARALYALQWATPVVVAYGVFSMEGITGITRVGEIDSSGRIGYSAIYETSGDSVSINYRLKGIENQDGVLALLDDAPTPPADLPPWVHKLSGLPRPDKASMGDIKLILNALEELGLETRVITE